MQIELSIVKELAYYEVHISLILVVMGEGT